MNVLSLFDGMSCGQLALHKAGIPYNAYYASEIDNHAMKVAKVNFPDTIHIGSVTDVTAENLPEIDLLIGGSPCQSFSFAGKRTGMSTTDNIEITSLQHYLDLRDAGFSFKGQSYLFWEYVRLLREVKPTYFLLENVRMAAKWKNLISDVLGVQPVAINSSLLSAQSRQRLYWTNIPDVTVPQDAGITLTDVLDYPGYDNTVEPIPQSIYKNVIVDYANIIAATGERHYVPCTSGFNDHVVGLEKSPCLRTCSPNTLLRDKWNNVRRPTRHERERLQTVPVGYTNSVSEAQAAKMLGNGWTVDVIAHILKNLKGTK